MPVTFNVQLAVPAAADDGVLRVAVTVLEADGRVRTFGSRHERLARDATADRRTTPRRPSSRR